MFHLGSRCIPLKITRDTDQNIDITPNNLTFIDIISHLIDKDPEKFSKFYTKGRLLFRIIFYTCQVATRADSKNGPSPLHNWRQ